MTQLIDVYCEWVNNLAFREKFRRNPETALAEAGFVLHPDDLQKIKAMLALDKTTNEVLDDRISK